MKNIDEVFQHEQWYYYKNDDIKILYQIQRIIIKCKSSDDQSDRFQEIKLAGDQGQTFQILPVANAVVEEKREQILDQVKGEHCQKRKSKLVELHAKQLNVGDELRNNGNKLWQKHSNHHASHDGNDGPRRGEIIRILNLLGQKILDVSIAVENRKHDNISENTPENTIYHPIVMFCYSYQAPNFLQK